MIKNCRKCKVVLIPNVNWISSYVRYDNKLCRACHKLEARMWRRKNPKSDKRKRNWHLKKYSLTIDQYDCMLRAQNGVCAICKRPPTKKRLAVDHDHLTGRNRGLLCGLCNRYLMNLIDTHKINPMEIVEYLDRPVALGL